MANNYAFEDIGNTQENISMLNETLHHIKDNTYDNLNGSQLHVSGITRYDVTLTPENIKNYLSEYKLLFTVPFTFMDNDDRHNFRNDKVVGKNEKSVYKEELSPELISARPDVFKYSLMVFINGEMYTNFTCIPFEDSIFVKFKVYDNYTPSTPGVRDGLLFSEIKSLVSANAVVSFVFVPNFTSASLKHSASNINFYNLLIDKAPDRDIEANTYDINTKFVSMVTSDNRLYAYTMVDGILNKSTATISYETEYPYFKILFLKNIREIKTIDSKDEYFSLDIKETPVPVENILLFRKTSDGRMYFDHETIVNRYYPNLYRLSNRKHSDTIIALIFYHDLVTDKPQYENEVDIYHKYAKELVSGNLTNISDLYNNQTYRDGLVVETFACDGIKTVFNVTRQHKNLDYIVSNGSLSRIFPSDNYVYDYENHTITFKTPPGFSVCEGTDDVSNFISIFSVKVRTKTGEKELKTSEYTIVNNRVVVNSLPTGATLVISGLTFNSFNAVFIYSVKQHSFVYNYGTSIYQLPNDCNEIVNISINGENFNGYSFNSSNKKLGITSNLPNFKSEVIYLQESQSHSFIPNIEMREIKSIDCYSSIENTNLYYSYYTTLYKQNNDSNYFTYEKGTNGIINKISFKTPVGKCKLIINGWKNTTVTVTYRDDNQDQSVSKYLVDYTPTKLTYDIPNFLNSDYNEFEYKSNKLIDLIEYNGNHYSVYLSKLGIFSENNELAILTGNPGVTVFELNSPFRRKPNNIRIFRNGKRVPEQAIRYTYDEVNAKFILRILLRNVSTDIFTVIYTEESNPPVYLMNHIHKSFIPETGIVDLTGDIDKPLDFKWYDMYLNGNKLTEDTAEFIGSYVLRIKNLNTRRHLEIFEKNYENLNYPNETETEDMSSFIYKYLKHHLLFNFSLNDTDVDILADLIIDYIEFLNDYLSKKWKIINPDIKQLTRAIINKYYGISVSNTDYNVFINPDNTKYMLQDKDIIFIPDNGITNRS